MIPLDKFLSCVKENAARTHAYESGHDGSDGKCDCIGLIIGALKLAGFKWPGVHGSNWAARNAMDSLQYIPDATEMYVGEIVYKAKEPGESGYAPPDRYKDSRDLRDYYHVGVVTQTAPLVITHCTTVDGGIQRDGKAGNWRWGGKLKYVDYAEGDGHMKAIYQAKVHADNDYPVKMRAEASTKAEILAKIPQGEIVDVLGTVGSNEGEWGFILYGDQTGYMMRKFLLPVNEAEADDDGETVTVNRAELEIWADTLESLLDEIRDKLGRG